MERLTKKALTNISVAWGPYLGFISAAAFLVVCVFVCFLDYQAITGKDPQTIGMTRS